MPLSRLQKYGAFVLVLPWMLNALGNPLSAFADYASLESGHKQLFIVSAYYSPLPDQEYYLRGNYEAELRLNGNGTNGADGTAVYPGMLAAPAGYDFGTKIYLPGLGVGTVHDRGGAIQSHVGYDRIDVWMGSGSAGLNRALNWGIRRVEGIIYDDQNVPEKLDFDFISSALPSASSDALKSLDSGDQGSAVEELQQKLTTLGFYTGPVTGNYGEMTTAAVLAFQQSTQLVDSADSPGAGVFGPKTRLALQSKISGDNASSASTQIATTELTSPVLPITSLSSQKIEIGTKGSEVKRLQMILASMGYFSGTFNENYGPQTTAAVLAFQKDQKLVGSADSPGAGVVGPKTYTRLAAVLTDYKTTHRNFTEQEATLTFDSEDAVNSNNLLAAVGEEVRQSAQKENDLLAAAAHLAPGDRNDTVKLLQEKLITAGFLAPGNATGFYGTETRKAVFALQKKYELAFDPNAPWAGTFGPKTRLALLSALQLS